MSAERQAQYVQRGQDQAKTAWGWVSAAEKSHFKERYATLARKLPSYLQVSGLGQTMAFLYAKSKDVGAEQMLCKQLSIYLQTRFGGTEVDVMAMIIKLEPDVYRRATQELMQVTDWLKRFAEGRLGKGSDD